MGDRDISVTVLPLAHSTRFEREPRYFSELVVWHQIVSLRLRVPLFLFATLAGCTVTTDLAGLVGPPLAEGDAAPPVTDAAPEAGPTTDASADVTGCARYPGAAFCVDFEQPSSLSAGLWTESDEKSTNGTLGLTQTNVVSPRNAALFDLTKVGACSYLQNTKGMPGTFSAVTTRLDLRIETEGIFNTVSFSVSPKLSFTLILAFGSNRSVRLFLQKNDEGTLTESAGKDDTLDVDPLGRWLPVSMNASSSTGTATATIATKTIVLPLPGDFVLKDPFSTVGPYCSSKPQRATIDDVVITTTTP